MLSCYVMLILLVDLPVMMIWSCLCLVYCLSLGVQSLCDSESYVRKRNQPEVLVRESCGMCKFLPQLNCAPFARLLQQPRLVHPK